MIAAIFDTETTGLIKNSAQPLAKQPHIIEFSGLLVDTETDEELGALDFLCDPGIAITAEITKITGITQAMVKGTKPFADRQKEVDAFFAQANAVAAHNLSYDQSMVEFEVARQGKLFAWPERRICTVEATEHLKGHRLSLAALHELLFGETFADAHRAKNDVAALRRCFIELIKREVI